MEKDYDGLVERLDAAYSDLKTPCVNPVGAIKREEVMDLLKEASDAIGKLLYSRDFSDVLTKLASLESDARDIADDISCCYDDLSAMS